MRGAVRRVWLGEEMYELLRNPSLSGGLHYLWLIAYNIALLPLVAVIPLPQSREAPCGWVSLFRNKVLRLPPVETRAPPWQRLAAGR